MLDSDDLMVVLNWLINMQEAGLTLDEVIQGLQDGTLTTPTASNITQ